MDNLDPHSQLVIHPHFWKPLNPTSHIGRPFQTVLVICETARKLLQSKSPRSRGRLGLRKLCLSDSGSHGQSAYSQLKFAPTPDSSPGFSTTGQQPRGIEDE